MRVELSRSERVFPWRLFNHHEKFLCNLKTTTFSFGWWQTPKKNMTMNTERRNQLESWFSLLPFGIVVIITVMTMKNGHYLPTFAVLTPNAWPNTTSLFYQQWKQVRQTKKNQYCRFHSRALLWPVVLWAPS